MNSFRDDADLDACRLCPRLCGADRRRASGFCGGGPRARVHTFGPHYGEEPPISGTRGSGTVFFSRCSMRCLYCQNYPWSQSGRGRDVGAEGLADIFERLYRQGCHNWNLVSPTPWLPDIVRALAGRRREERLPVVFNTSGYETPETLAAMDPWVDIYLTDLRYSDPATAAAASQTPDYVEVAREALRLMWRTRGPLRVDGDGMAVRGVICRILVLPGHAREALDNLVWLADNLGTDVPVSLMSQYTPAWRARDLPVWNRPLTAGEYAPVQAAVGSLGFSNGWVQDLETAVSPALIGYNMPAAEPAAMAVAG